MTSQWSFFVGYFQDANIFLNSRCKSIREKEIAIIKTSWTILDQQYTLKSPVGIYLYLFRITTMISINIFYCYLYLLKYLNRLQEEYLDILNWNDM